MPADEAFAAFYERHYKMVYRICLVYLKNTADAEACTEDVFVKVLTGGFTFQNEAHERAWLSVTTVNLCKDRLKHWWQKKTEPLEAAAERSDQATPALDETLEVVCRLPAKYKDVICLYYYLGYQTDEIAALLKKPPSTIRNHLREARMVLRKQLGGNDL